MNPVADKRQTGDPSGSSVIVPIEILERALSKARIEYRSSGEDCTTKDYECWAEFEALAHYMPEGWRCAL